MSESRFSKFEVEGPSKFEVLMVFLGILGPMACLVIESYLHFCALIYFNPIPTPFFSFLVALVPLSNIFSLSVYKKGSLAVLRYASILNGFAVCVSLLYAIAFLPLAPLGLAFIVAMGIGLLVFAPFFSFCVMLKMRRKITARMKEFGATALPLDICASILLLLCGALGFSEGLTRACNEQIYRNPANAAKDLLLLRAFGNTNSMLRACYGLDERRNFLNIGSYAVSLFGGIEPRLYDYYYYNSDPRRSNFKRELFYRATGRSFNSFPRPQGNFAEIFPFSDDDYYWYQGNDQDFAGEIVGGVVKGLKLVQSNIGGQVDPDAAVEHLVWTMKFSKEAYGSRELRTELQLPPGAVISDCWLIVDGKRLDASFQARSQARTQYVKQANNQQTGLLVATAGPGRVLIQAPAINGSLDLCVQIDAPMEIESENKALCTLPSLIERNFELACQTEVKLVQLAKTSSDVSLLQVKSARSARKFSNAQLFMGPDYVLDGFDAPPFSEYSRDKNKQAFLSENPYNASTRGAQIIRKSRLKEKPLVVVLDGSASMEKSIKELLDGLSQIVFSDATLVWASDEPILVAEHVRTDSSVWKNALARIADSACVGGQDNAAALALAFNSVDLKQGSNIVWLHGPQAVEIGKLKMDELWRPLSAKSTLYEYQAAMGPNKLIKSLDKSPSVKSISHVYGLRSDLESVFLQLAGRKDVFEIERKFIAAKTAEQINAPTFLSQLCANDWILQRLGDERENALNGKIAQGYHIVTPLTSAIVVLPTDWTVQTESTSERDESVSLDSTAAHDKLKASSAGEAAPTATAAISGAKAELNSATANKSSAGSSKEQSAQVLTDAPSVAPIPIDTNSNNIMDIATKPEPPLNMLILISMFVAALIAWKQRVLKSKCAR
ncbi:MAG: hypothetical protein K2X27_26935 [Candidatus Obscuribacterales bacterium]|nr:hypothetical protein [Candidatus Obscuribacterales bacterium]